MLINIQLLRFVAAALVLAYHASSHLRSAGVDQGALFALTESVGFAGVDVFFVISGFIMAHTTAAASGVRDAWAFMRRRVARIYSGYWPFFLLALAVYAWTAPDHISEAALVRSAFLWPANRLLISVSWTLVFEMLFYLMYSILLAGPTSRRTAMTWLLLAIVVAWTTHAHFIRHAYDPGMLETISLAEYYLVSPYTAEFLAGALLGRHVHAVMPSRRGAWWLLIAGTGLYLAGGWLNDAQFDGQIEQGYYVVYRVLIFGTASLLIVHGLVGLDLHGLRAPMRFSLLAGGASYAIYLSHTILLTAARHLGFGEVTSSLSNVAAQAAFLVLSVLIIVCSIMHYRVIERPLHRAFRKALKVS